MIDHVRQISPQPTDRVVFIGQTGSGKTTLARYLARQRPYFVGLFPKGLESAKGWEGTRVTSLAQIDHLKAREHPRIIYAPDLFELDDWETLNAFFKWVYERRNTTLYIDELYAVTKGDQCPDYMKACYTRGRERHVETWGATQRPSRVPLMVFSESEHFYCFCLKAPQDRERVHDYTGIDEDALAVGVLPKHEFYYAPQDGSVLGPLRLKLTKSQAQPPKVLDTAGRGT